MTTDARALIEDGKAVCTHPEIVPIDADWARCTACGDSTFLLHDFGEDPDPINSEIVRLRTELGELKLVIEQQDRDLSRMRCDLEASRAMNRHFEQERDSWGEAYKQRAAKTDKRVAELEAGLCALSSKMASREDTTTISATGAKTSMRYSTRQETHARRRSDSTDGPALLDHNAHRRRLRVRTSDHGRRDLLRPLLARLHRTRRRGPREQDLRAPGAVLRGW
jgi:hypothetical protein